MFLFQGRKKQTTTPAKFLLSDDAIFFIKNFVINEKIIAGPLDAEALDRIVKLATAWEEDMIDPSSDSYADKAYDYPERKRNEMADKFVGEITGQWHDEELIPDFEDLNKRLGF